MKTSLPVVLVVNAGEFAQDVIREIVGYCGCSVEWLDAGVAWPPKLPRKEPAVVFGDEDARCLPLVMQQYPEASLVLAVQAGRGRSPVTQSVFSTVSKPVSFAGVVFAIERALVYRALAVGAWREAAGDVSDLLGGAGCMRRLYEAAEEMAGRDCHVAISGERGTGKERMARAIHRWSVRAAAPFAAADCRAFREQGQLTALLAGVVGRSAKRPHNVLSCTLFLGEVGSLSLSIQGELLTALRERRIRAIGDAEGIDLDIRVITASGDTLEKLAEEGRFLPELVGVLGERRVWIPPLRQRKDDVVFLARRVLARIDRERGIRAPLLPPSTEMLMLSYNWPGNARELRSVVAHAALLADGVIGPKDIDLPQPPDRLAQEAALRVLTNWAGERMVKGARPELAGSRDAKKNEDEAMT